ncbi:SRPBCC family protein [Evansella tamaricis]|uniref:SRPBCC family protein n=1 Tax=Evansella tamaricis TaxID=2069301 RepID=A0ABS6JL36_9BACI|nr:SRPBCC family protein [Evansella tamaricis]MBU9714389.1 SRPBCC family protein [Evansella tamaricis]
MADFIEERVMDKPVETVYNFLADPVNRQYIYSIVSDVEKLTGGDIAVGSRFREMRQFSNRKVGSEIEIIALEPSRLVTLKSEANGMNVIYRYTIEKAIDGTKVKCEATVEATKLRTKLMRPALVKMVKKEDTDHLLYVQKELDKQ